MRNSLRVCLLVSVPLLGIAFQRSPPADSSGCCTISGIVVDHATNRALRGVTVFLNPSDQPGAPLKQITGEDGAFAFSHLPPKKYALTAQRRGEQPVGYQQYEGFFTGIVVGPNNAS